MHTSDKWMRIRILLFLSVTFKTSTNRFLPYYFLNVPTFTVYHFLKIKIIKKKKSQNSRNQCFSYFICLMIEGSVSGAESGSVYLTNKSGSRGPKTYESYGFGFGSATLIETVSTRLQEGVNLISTVLSAKNISNIKM